MVNAGVDDALAVDVLDVQQIVVRTQHVRFVCVVGKKRFGRLVVRFPGFDLDELALGIPKGRELAAENATRVDADRAVEPVRLGHRGMAVDDHRLTTVVGCPIVPDRQAILVCLAGGLAVQAELAHARRRAALELLFETRVSDDELAVVQHVVAHQAVNEVGHLPPGLVRLAFELLQRLREPVGQTHVLAPELAHELGVVVAGDAQRRIVLDCLPHQPQTLQRLGSAVHQIPQEHELATVRVGHLWRPAVLRDDVAEVR